MLNKATAPNGFRKYWRHVLLQIIEAQIYMLLQTGKRAFDIYF